jgi:hypothetical protein
LEDGGLQLGHGAVGQLGRELDEMPVGVWREAVQAVARGGVRDDHRGLGAGDRGVERRHDRARVVPVDPVSGPAERLPFGGNRLDGGDAGDGAVDLGVVAVEQDHQPVQAMVGGEHGRLPRLPLLDLAVADQGVGLHPDAAEPVGDGEPDRGREPLPERAAGDLGDRRSLGADGLQGGAVLAVGVQFGRVQQPCLGGRAVGGDHVVAGRQHEVVEAAAQVRAEQRGHQLGGRQRLTEVAQALARDHPHRVQADPVGHELDGVRRQRCGSRELHAHGRPPGGTWVPMWLTGPP